MLSQPIFSIPGYIKLFWICAVTLALSGCGGGGGGGDGGSGGGTGGGGDTTTKSAPVLNAFTFSPTEAAAGIEITISGDIEFSDPDGDLGGGSFNYTYAGLTFSFPIDNELNGITQGVVNFILQAQLNSSVGPQDISGWLVDSTGRQSNVVTTTFNQLWTRQFGTDVEDIGAGIAIGTDVSVVVTGTTRGNLSGQVNKGLTDVFVTRISKIDGSEYWTRLLGSSNEDSAYDVVSRAIDGIYIVGDTIGMEFDGELSDGSLSGFLTKIDDVVGTKLWTALINTEGESDTVRAIDDFGGGVLVVGDTTGNLHGEMNAGSWDAFIAKYDPAGNRLWTRLLGTSGSDHAVGVAVVNEFDIYVAGYTDGNLGEDPSPGDPLVNFDVFVAKYSLQDGVLQWVKQIGTRCSELATDLKAVHPGVISIVGRIGIDCAFPGNSSSGLWDAFVARIDTNGDTLWISQFGTAMNDSAEGVAIDSINPGIFVTGFLESVYQPVDSLAGDRIFLSKYSLADGVQQWLVEPPNVGYAWGNRGHAVVTECCIALPEDAAKIFLTGAVRGAIDYHTNPSVGEADVFVLNYDGSGNRK